MSIQNISIRSTLVLVILGSLAATLMTIVEYTKQERPQAHFKEKMEAARLMEDCMSHLKETHFANEVAVDNINDPNDTRIIGTRYSPLTSGRGSLPVKLSTVNPNFAAMVIDLYKKAGLKKGDHIAIGATGSFPAMNIAACAAAEVMGLEVSMITSVTSSSWGANQPDYTYLDIHQSLHKDEFFSFPIIASSIGANQDIGRTLSPEGRDMAKEAITRNQLRFINGSSLEENVDQRMAILAERENSLGQKVQLYVNVGGGVASLGSDANSAGLPSGLMKKPKLNVFKDKQGVMFRLAAQKASLINFRNIQRLMSQYDLPRDPVPLPRTGEGKLFYDLQYDLRFVWGTMLLLALLIVGVIWFDKRQNALGKAVIKTES